MPVDGPDDPIDDPKAPRELIGSFRAIVDGRAQRWVAFAVTMLSPIWAVAWKYLP